jgi:primosomal protein N' (replication factor Y)
MLIRASSRPPLRWLLRQLRPRLGEAGSGEFKTMANVDVDPQSLL